MGLVILATLAAATGCRRSTALTRAKGSRPGESLVIRQSFAGGAAATGAAVEVIDVADKLGYLIEEGIELKDVGGVGSSNPEKLIALARGEVDVLHIAVPSVVAAIANGIRARYVAPLMTTTAKQQSGQIVSSGGLVVRAASGLHEPNEFVGKKIGLSARGSSPDYFLQQWFKKAHVDINKVNITLVPSNTSIQALKSGTVDGVWLFSSSYFDALNDPGLATAAKDADIVGSRLHCGYLVSLDMIHKHPQKMAGLARAIIRAWNWEADHPKELYDVARQILTDRHLNPDLARYVYAWQLPDGRIRDDDIQFWIDQLTESGQITKPLTIADIFVDLRETYTN